MHQRSLFDLGIRADLWDQLVHWGQDLPGSRETLFVLGVRVVHYLWVLGVQAVLSLPVLQHCHLFLEGLEHHFGLVDRMIRVYPDYQVDLSVLQK